MPRLAFSRKSLKFGFLGQLGLGPGQALLQQLYGFGWIHNVGFSLQQYELSKNISSLWRSE